MPRLQHVDSRAVDTVLAMPGRLVDRHPAVTPQRLIAQLVPPPTFVDVSFDSYPRSR
jgi:cell division protein ZapE